MEQRADIRRTNEGQMADDEKTADVFVIELQAQRKAYRDAEQEYQYWRARLLRRADRVVLLARVSQKEGA